MSETPADTWELADQLEALAKMLKKAPKLNLVKRVELTQLTEVTTLPSQSPEYNGLTVKKLRAECKKRGIKIPRGYNKPDIIRLLETDDVKKTTIGQISVAFSDE